MALHNARKRVGVIGDGVFTRSAVIVNFDKRVAVDPDYQNDFVVVVVAVVLDKIFRLNAVHSLFGSQLIIALQNFELLS